MLCGSLDEKGVWRRMDTCIAELFYCPPETITTLLINYTPIQNKKFFLNLDIREIFSKNHAKQLLFFSP